MPLSRATRRALVRGLLLAVSCRVPPEPASQSDPAQDARGVARSVSFLWASAKRLAVGTPVARVGRFPNRVPVAEPFAKTTRRSACQTFGRRDKRVRGPHALSRMPREQSLPPCVAETMPRSAKRLALRNIFLLRHRIGHTPSVRAMASSP